jgi:hypothetical protein
MPSFRLNGLKNGDRIGGLPVHRTPIAGFFGGREVSDAPSVPGNDVTTIVVSQATANVNSCMLSLATKFITSHTKQKNARL